MSSSASQNVIGFKSPQEEQEEKERIEHERKIEQWYIEIGHEIGHELVYLRDDLCSRLHFFTEEREEASWKEDAKRANEREEEEEEEDPKEYAKRANERGLKRGLKRMDEEEKERVYFIMASDGQEYGMYTDPSTGDDVSPTTAAHSWCLSGFDREFRMFTDPDDLVNYPKLDPNCCRCGEPLVG